VESQAFFLDGRRGRVVGSVVGVLVFDRWDVVAPAVQALMVVPVDPFEDLELDVFEGSPRSEAADDLGLEEPVEGFGGGVEAPMSSGCVEGVFVA
jgi:hypothetical protein